MAREAEEDVALAVAAGSAASGRTLSAPVRLPGSDRSAVIRCQDEADGSVVVKTYPRDRFGSSCFAAEAAGLAVTGGTGLAPELIAADAGRLTVVMSDLGPGPSLADALLGSSAGAASQTLLTWARECGVLAAATSGCLDHFETLKYRYLDGRPDQTEAVRLPGLILRAGDRVAALRAQSGTALSGLQVPAGLAAELRAVAVAVGTGRYPIFSPGDICPDNNLVQGKSVRFLDFESAGTYSAFLDAAYIRMPFAGCWCTFRLPAGLAAEAEAVYRAHVVAVHPALADDDVWMAGLRYAVTAWSLSSFGWLLHRAMEGDDPLEPGRVSPTARQLMRHRWRVLLAELEAGDDLPALTLLTRSLLTATEVWQAAELPLYPAFR
jgi:hypothetical protein